MHLFRLVIMFALVVMIFAFRLPSNILHPRQYATVLYADPGKLLYDAAVDGDVSKMKIAIKECAGNADQLNYANSQRYGRTPLVIACYYNNVDAVKLLLSTPGVDVNKGIDFGTITDCSIYCHIESASYLNTNYSYLITILILILTILITGSTALMYAAHRGHLETVRALLADKRTNVL
jgi:hypothetical protein